LSQIEFFVKNCNSCHKLKILSKVRIVVKNYNFGEKL